MDKNTSRISTKAGSIFEVPLGRINGYVAVVCHSKFCVLDEFSSRRPSLSQLAEADVLEFLDTGHESAGAGKWPRVGKHRRFAEMYPPSYRSLGYVYIGSEYRPERPEDSCIPETTTISNECAVRRLRILAGLDEPGSDADCYQKKRLIDPLEAPMSVADNDIAERIQIQFSEYVDEGLSAIDAINACREFFAEDLDDTDLRVACELAFADLAADEGCLTKTLRDAALAILDCEDEAYAVADRWPASDSSERYRVMKFRSQALSGLRKKLEAANVGE